MIGTGRKNALYVAVSAAITGGIFVYLFTIVRPAEVIRAILNVSVCGLLAYMGVSLSSAILRNVRYLILIRATETSIPISGWQMFLVTLVRNLFTDLVPARLGSLIYVAVLSARFGFPVEIGTSVWAVAFVLDMVVMVPLMAVGVAVVGTETLGISPRILWTAATLFLVLTAVILVQLPRFMRLGGRVCAKILPRGMRGQLIGEKLRLASEQVAVIYRAGVGLRVTILSFLVRILKYGCLALMLYAILNPIDPSRYTLRQIGFWPVFVGASLAELSSSMPFSGFGGFGLYEGVWGVAFYLLGYPRELAILSGFSAHIIGQIYGLSLGAAAILILMVQAAGLRGGGENQRRAGRQI